MRRLYASQPYSTAPEHAAARPGLAESTNLWPIPPFLLLPGFARDFHRGGAVGQPDLPVLDRALQLHRTLRHPFQSFTRFRRDVDHRDVFRAVDLAGDLLEPDMAGCAVRVHHYL